MRYRTLGTTGLQVSVIALGAMKLIGPETGENRAVVNRALDAGVNLVDTADIYGRGENERIVGAALQGRRSDVVLATKVHHPMGVDPTMRGNSRRWLIRACEDSLRRLQTDYIDLYQLHRPDPACSLEESVDAMATLVRAGKIRYFGTSTFPASRLVEMQWAARRRGHPRPATEQPPYSILVRGAENDVLPACERHGIGVLNYSPLAGGWLSKPATAETLPLPQDGHRADEHAAKVAATLALIELAEQAGLPISSLAVGWVLEHPAISSAIVGPRTLDQLLGLLPAADGRLGPDLLDAIDSIVAPGTTLLRQDSGTIWRYGRRVDPYPAADRRRPASYVSSDATGAR